MAAVTWTDLAATTEVVGTTLRKKAGNPQMPDAPRSVQERICQLMRDSSLTASTSADAGACWMSQKVVPLSTAPRTREGR